MVVQCDSILEWREQYVRRVLNVDFVPLTDAPFHAEVAPIIGRIARVVHSPGVTIRDKELVKDGDDHFSLLISQSRALDVWHCRRALQLGRGEAALMNLCETGAVGARDEVRYIGVIVPPPALTDRTANVDDLLMQRLPQRCEALQLLRSYLGSLERNRVADKAHDIVIQHIYDLVALAVTSHGALGETTLSAVAAARLSAALEWIAAHFEEPEISVAAVAQSQGVSSRYMQRLLQESGLSFTARVSELRLQRALALLTRSGDDSVRISDIALQVGFSDISHFNRLFRARFGETPTAVRAGRRADAVESSVAVTSLHSIPAGAAPNNLV